MNETVQQGRIAWARLKKNGKNWDGWKTVGHALLEGRKKACATPAPPPRQVAAIPTLSMIGSPITGSTCCKRSAPSCLWQWASCPR